VTYKRRRVKEGGVRAQGAHETTGRPSRMLLFNGSQGRPTGWESSIVGLPRSAWGKFFRIRNVGKGKGESFTLKGYLQAGRRIQKLKKPKPQSAIQEKELTSGLAVIRARTRM